MTATTTHQRRRFVLRHNDAYVYYLDSADLGSKRTSDIEQLALYADDTPMQYLGGQRYHGGWFAADHRATRFYVEDPATKVIDHYTLNDPAATSVKYPAILTPEQFTALGDDENRWNLYAAVYAELPPVRVEIGVDTRDWLELDGSPTPDVPQGTPAWQPDLFVGLMERPEFHHLLPGRITGLDKAVAKRLEGLLGMFRVSNGRDGQPAGVYATVSVPFEQPVTRYEPNRSARTGKAIRGGRTEPRMVSRELRLPVPVEVRGETYAQAAAMWHEQVKFWVGVVAAAGRGGAKACNHCGGHGFVGGDVFTEFDVPKGVWS